MDADSQKSGNTTSTAERCRSCGKAVREDHASFPFCTERCRMGDLGKWFSESYTISRPMEERDLEEGD